jgi:hypothetical protein
LLWDIDEAGRIEETFDDFLEKSFGPAREPMRAYYRLMHRFEDSQPRPLLSSDLLGRMYRLLAEARGLTDDAGIRARLDDLSLYTRHAELYHATVNASGSKRQELYDQWVQHSYHMADRKMVHTSRMGGRHYAPGRRDRCGQPSRNEKGNAAVGPSVHPGGDRRVCERGHRRQRPAGFPAGGFQRRPGAGGGRLNLPDSARGQLRQSESAHRQSRVPHLGRANRARSVCAFWAE